MIDMLAGAKGEQSVQASGLELQRGCSQAWLPGMTTFGDDHNFVPVIMDGVEHGGGRGRLSRGMIRKMVCRESAQSQPAHAHICCAYACASDSDPRRGADIKPTIYPSDRYAYIQSYICMCSRGSFVGLVRCSVLSIFLYYFRHVCTTRFRTFVRM